MNTEYNMDINIGSQLLKNVDNTASSFYNLNIHHQRGKMKKMGFKYLLKNPKLLQVDSSYCKFGPIGLCRFIHEECGILFSDQEWYRLTSTLSSVNNSHITESRD